MLLFSAAGPLQKKEIGGNQGANSPDLSPRVAGIEFLSWVGRISRGEIRRSGEGRRPTKMRAVSYDGQNGLTATARMPQFA